MSHASRASNRPTATGRPLIISHRANMKTDPENTIAGICSAMAACVDGIEIDVQATADGVPVLMHDCTMRRATGDPRAVGDVRAEETRGLRVRPPRAEAASAPIATLAEALAAVGDQGILVLDIKMENIAPMVAKVIRDAGAQRRIALLCDFDEAAAYRALLPDVAITVGLRAGAIKRDGLIPLLDRAVELGLAGVSLRTRILDACAVEAAHQRGLAVKTWTIDRDADFERVVADGVDAVCANYPERLRPLRDRLTARPSI